jgi:hypothetical protein
MPKTREKDTDFTLKTFEKDIRRNKYKHPMSVARFVLDENYVYKPYRKDKKDDNEWDPLNDPTLEEYNLSKKGLNPNAKEFEFKLRSSRKASRKSRKASRRSRKASRRSRKASRRSRKASRRSRKSSRRSRKSSRKSKP